MKKKIILSITIIIMFLCSPDNIKAEPLVCKYTLSDSDSAGELKILQISVNSRNEADVKIFAPNGTTELEKNNKIFPSSLYIGDAGHEWKIEFSLNDYLNESFTNSPNTCPDLTMNAIDSKEFLIYMWKEEPKYSKLTLSGNKVEIAKQCGPWRVQINEGPADVTVSINTKKERQLCIKFLEKEACESRLDSGTLGATVFNSAAAATIQIASKTQFDKIFINVNPDTNTFTCPEKVYFKTSTSEGNAYELTTDPTDAVEQLILMDTDTIYAKEFPFNYEGTIDFCAINELIDWIKEVLGFIQLGVIVIVMLLSILDYVKALTASDSDAMKKANKSLMTRIIVIALILLVGPLVQFVLDLFTNGDISTCGIA